MKTLPRSLKSARTGTVAPSFAFAGVALMTLLLSVGDAFAVGFRLPNQDPEGIARGNAFVATADNPSAIYYNPAGITQLPGTQARVGLYFISAHTEYDSDIFGQSHTDGTFQAVPQVYLTHSIKDTPITLGLGVYAPYGLSLAWQSPAFSIFSHRGKLLYATVNPVVAWQVNPKLSIAVGPTLNYADAKLQSDAFKFRGSDFAPGFNAGIMWQPIEQLSFGGKYHYETDVELDGHSSVYIPFTLSRTSTKAKAHLPQFATMGVSYRPTPNWNFEVDVDWTDWNTLDAINFRRSDGITIPFLFNYRSSWMYEVGATRQLGDGWYVSAGYIFSENSSPDHNFNAIVPDGDLHLGSIGFGHHGKRWDWAVGYHFAYGERTVTGDVNPLFNAKYKTFNNAINIAATLKF